MMRKTSRPLPSPTISTGAFGYPLEEAARIAIDTIVGQIPELSSVEHVAMVLFSSHDLQIHESYLDQKVHA